MPFAPLLAVLLVQTPLATAAGTTVGDGGLFPYPLEVHHLPNGLQVVLVPTGPSGEAGGLAAYYTLVRVGSRNEVEAGRTGFAHFFEHMMFRGTRANPAEQYAQMLQAAGVNDNAETSDDFTLYTNYGPTSALPTVIALEADRFAHLSYREPEFQTEAKAVLGEYNKDVADPDFALDEALHKAAFRKSTYRHTTMGFLKDVQRMPQAYGYSLDFFKRWYVPGNTTIFVVGDFSAPTVFAQIAKAYGGWKGALSSLKIPREPPQTGAVSVTLHWPGETLPRVALAFHTPSLGNDLRAAAVQNLLGPYLVGPASALYRSAILEQHLAVSLQSWYGDHRDPNLFTLVATAKSDSGLQPLKDAVERAIAELQQQGADPKLLADVKTNQHYGTLMGLETPAAVAGLLATSAAATGDPASVDLLGRALEQVEGADLQNFARQYLTPRNQTTVWLRPPARAAALGPNQAAGRGATR